MLRTSLFAILVAVGGALPAEAHDYRLGGLVIDHPWSRATPPGAEVAGGFMTIRNEGEAADRLVGGSAGFANGVEVHRTTMDDGVMRMREVEGGLEIPAGESVTLEPGGYHVMFVGLAEPLVEGEARIATLAFERAGAVEVEFTVEAMGYGGRHDDGETTH